MQARIDQLLELLDLEPLDTHLFRGVSPAGERNRVFGGQVLGQALVAAGRTVDERLLHSMHAYFLRPGDPKRPILYEVERSRDGGSFTSRRVVAIQQGKPIFNLSASFQRAEPGLDHQAAMPDTASPELFITEEEQLALLYQQDPQNYRHPDYFQWPIEFRHVDHSNSRRHEVHPPQHRVWMRAVAPLPDALILHQ
ncbi:MAG TPA: thioesterase family protein, partial [Pseudomonadales bacterium]|nr:thioesterase family protein [Pseudomonadales bacterium]